MEDFRVPASLMILVGFTDFVESGTILLFSNNLHNERIDMLRVLVGMDAGAGASSGK